MTRISGRGLSTLSLVLILVLVVPVLAGPVPLNTTIDGPRNIGDDYSFSLVNVSTGATIHNLTVVYHTTVQAFRVLHNITWYSPAWGTWSYQYPPAGNEYLMVWVKQYEEGMPWVGWDQSFFPLLVGGTSWVQPDPVLMGDLVDLNNNTFPAIIQEAQQKYSPGAGFLPGSPYGFIDGLQYNFINPGLSNAWTGYILYEIPTGDDLGDVQVAGTFGYHGTPLWNLIPREINQSSPEMAGYLLRTRMLSQINTGLRLPDSIGMRSRA